MASDRIVSVVVITYNRLHLLKDTVQSFLRTTSYPRNYLELILCDDGSPRDVQEEMKKLPFDKFLFDEKNRGLGHNTNKGIRAARGDYILQLQDDWHCRGPNDFLQMGVEVLERNRDLMAVRFYPFPQEIAATVRRCEDGKSLIIPREHCGNLSRHFSYSDTPHVKSRRFHETFGLYKVNVPMTKMELDFCARVDVHPEPVIAAIQGLEPFCHTGAEFSFNPGKRRDALKNALLANPMTRYPFAAYLALKHRFKLPLP